MEQDKDCALTNTSVDLIVLPCLSFASPLLLFALTCHFPVFLPFEDFIFNFEAVQRWKEERMKGWETQDGSFEREAKMDWQNKSGNGEMAMERELGGGGEKWGR